MTTTTKHSFANRVGSGAAVGAGIVQLSAEKCVLRNLSVFNGHTAASYIQVFDTKTEPAALAVPDYLIGKLPADTGYESERSFSLSDGCYVALSSTPFVYTAVAANAAFSGEVQ